MNKSCHNSLKPIVEDISQWVPCTEILYKCPKCDTSFRILGSNERFCHMCGQKIDWEGIPTHLAESYQESDDYNEHKKFIQRLNEQIQKGKSK